MYKNRNKGSGLIMDDIIEKVMTFINENTNILIGVCVFLILVLIGYLIDNSVKSKRVRKDIKNKDQVPENIKKDIIEEANAKKENSELIEKKEEPTVKEDNKNVPEDSFIMGNANELEISNNPNINVGFELTENKEAEMNNNVDIPSELNVGFDLDSSTLVSNQSNVELSINNDNYKNDKKLFEILSEEPKSLENSTMNNESAELDAIMNKLNNFNNSDDQDENYTNIF